ncbi:hypothetical protein H6S82_09775 [Planktothrix sp. FACHB-1355]|uniref:Uncharacterized protein n=1 Tax=Aerosakkonema funiforme FACHB-1375 TaxID=2949571 RepID=A0A926VLP6_9CYAN|nr:MULTISPECIES: hypothetical protein [Oscillatoriales]MBD2185082.1 hypothetical protein [Aerosakkonema funiforme FACHB-1375]MBD3559147.1 hypothetical protein [Planktothrix sp. FACHB-1355]
MSDFSSEKWQTIKTLAARLQAIKTIIETFDGQINNQPFAEELRPIKEQLEADFEGSLNALLDLIDEDDI